MPNSRQGHRAGPVQVRRPRAAWYLVAVLALLIAVPLGLVGLVGLAWHDWRQPDSPTDRVTLARGVRYDLIAVAGGNGDVWTRLAPGDHVSCVFTPTGGPGGFGRGLVVPDQHRPRHPSTRDTAELGSFTAPSDGSYGVRCADRTGDAAGDLDVRAQPAPPLWVTVVLCVAIGLVLGAVVWIIALVRMRARSRLLRAAIDAGADLTIG